MSQLLYPSPHQPPLLHHSASAPCPSVNNPVPVSQPPVLPCALCLSNLQLLEDLWGQEW